MLRMHILPFLFALLSFSAFGQDFDYAPTDTTEQTEEKKEPFVDKLYFGGGFGASFGNETFINLSPAVFYKATDRFHPGVSVRYLYYATPGYKEHVFGGSAIGRYFVLRDFSILKNVYIHAEQEVLNGYVNSTSTDRRNFYSTYLGGGSLISIGGSFYINAEILYQYSYSQLYTPRNPVVRIGVIGGF